MVAVRQTELNKLNGDVLTIALHILNGGIKDQVLMAIGNLTYILYIKALEDHYLLGLRHYFHNVSQYHLLSSLRV